MKKRILIAALATCVLLSFAGCASGEVDHTTSPANSLQSSQSTSSATDTSATTSTSYGATNPYIRNVRESFVEFSEAEDCSFSVSSSVGVKTYEGGLKNYSFSVVTSLATDSSVSFYDEKGSYSIFLPNDSATQEAKDLLGAAIYAAAPEIGISSAKQEAQALSNTMPPTTSEPCRTSLGAYGDYSIWIEYESDLTGSFTVVAHHNADHEYTDVSALDLASYQEMTYEEISSPMNVGSYCKMTASVTSTGYDSEFGEDNVTISKDGHNYEIVYNYRTEPISFTPGETRTFYFYVGDGVLSLRGVE